MLSLSDASQEWMVKGLSWSGLSGWGWCSRSELDWISNLQDILRTWVTLMPLRPWSTGIPETHVCKCVCVCVCVLSGEGGISVFTSRKSLYQPPRIRKPSQPGTETIPWRDGLDFWSWQKVNGYSERQHMLTLYPVFQGLGLASTQQRPSFWEADLTREDFLSYVQFLLCRGVGGGIMGNWSATRSVVFAFFFLKKRTWKHFWLFRCLFMCAGRQMCMHTKHKHVCEGSGKYLRA